MAIHVSRANAVKNYPASKNVHPIWGSVGTLGNMQKLGWRAVGAVIRPCVTMRILCPHYPFVFLPIAAFVGRSLYLSV